MYGGEVHDTVHWAHTPLRSRSRGFVWFFSFLAWYEDIKRKNQNVILLLDEPGSIFTWAGTGRPSDLF